MKTQGGIFNIFRLLLLVVLLCHVFCLSSASEADIRRACAATDFPTDCVAFLESEPGSQEADLRGLTKIILQQSQRKATDTYTTIRLLLNDPNLGNSLRAPLGYCLDNYPQGVINSLQEALKAVDANDYNSAAALSSACATTADDCEKRFQASPVASPIKQQDELQVKLCVIGGGLAQQLL